MQSVSGDGGSATLHSVVEELVRFRVKVRQFALATGEATREAQQQQRLERQPLLEACDVLRQDLAAHGISIKVSRRGRVTGRSPEALGESAQTPAVKALCQTHSCDRVGGWSQRDMEARGGHGRPRFSLRPQGAPTPAFSLQRQLSAWPLLSVQLRL